MNNIDWTHCHMPHCSNGLPTLIRPGVADNQPICFDHAKREVIQNPSPDYLAFKGRPTKERS